MEKCDNEKAECGGRREFLVKASVMAGGLVLSLSGAARAKGKIDAADAADAAILKLGADSPLNKVGGFETIETKAGKVIVVRTGDGEFKAFSAVCPHKGGPISYDETSKQLVCSWHGSEFDMNGKVVKGPARANLAAYAAENEIVVTLAPKA